MYKLLSLSYEEGKRLEEVIQIENQDTSPQLYMDLANSEYRTLSKPVVKIRRDEDVDRLIGGNSSYHSLLFHKRFGKQLLFDNDFSEVIRGTEMIVNFINVKFEEGKDYAVVEKIDVTRHLQNFSATIFAIINDISPSCDGIHISNVLSSTLSQYEMNIFIIEGENLLNTTTNYEGKGSQHEQLFNLGRFLYTSSPSDLPFKIDRKGFNL